MSNIQTLAGSTMWAAVATLLVFATLEPVSVAHAATPGAKECQAQTAVITPAGNLQRA